MDDRPGLRSLFNGFGIRMKVNLSFACVLAFLAIVSGMTYFAFRSSSESLELYSQRVTVVGIARDIDRSFVVVRRFVREYALSGEDLNVESVKTEAGLLRGLLRQGLTVVTNSERHQRLEAILASTNAYIMNFDQVVTLKREHAKLIQTSLDPQGLAQQRKFEALIAAATKAGDANMAALANELLKQFMIVRLNVNKLLGRHDTAAGEEAGSQFTALDTVLGAADAAARGTPDQQVLGDLLAGVNRYRETFREAAALDARIRGLIDGAMTAMGTQVQADAEAIKASGIADEEFEKQTALATMDRTSTIVLALSVGGLAVGAIFAWLIGGSIAGPVVRMAAAMRQLAAGNLEQEIPALDRRDEVGQMAQAMLVFRQNAVRAREFQGEAEQIRTAKDRRQSAMDQYTQDFGMSASGVMATLAGAAESMRKTAGDMTDAARRTRETASRTAQNANTSAQNLGAVAAAAEEMAASIHEISEQVSRATHAANSAVDLASATDVKVGGVAEAVERVGNVVRLISDIAGQTNLLALNATIEAARAGDAGRGFAVVAGEVKLLAAQTAKATEEISSQIAAIRGATGEAVTAVREVSAAIGRVNEVAAAIAAAVEQQSATTREIAASVQTVTTATQEASRDMEEVSAVSETAQESSKTVVDSADAVGGTADVLRAELNQFLASMAKTGDADRRRYERVPGGGAEAVLRPLGQAELRAVIVDISRGGMAVRTDWWAAAGTEVQVVLPGTEHPVTARTARRQNDALVLAFRQDETMLLQVDMALARIGAAAARMAA